MQTREKLLAAGLGSVLAIGWVVPTVWSAVRAPVTDREQTLRSLNRRLDSREDDELKTMAAIKRLADWRRRALSEDALTAQRVYQAWLTQLADESGWRDLQVTPGRTRPVGPGTSVSVTIEADATAAEVSDFLTRFNESGVLHSVEFATLTAETSNPDVPIEVTLTATALSLPDGGARPLPYAELTVVETSEDSKQLDVSPALQVSEPFDVTVEIAGKRRIATVKGTTDDGLLKLSWEGDPPASVPAGAKLVTSPYEADETGVSPWNAFAKAGPFSMPRPEGTPVVERPATKPNAPPQLEAIDAYSLLPGETWTVAVDADDPDGPDDELRLSLDDAPPGTSLKDGTLTVAMPTGSSPGERKFEVIARDEGGAESRMEVVVNVLVDPETTTELVGAVRIDDEPAAWFIDRKTGERIVRRVGDEIKAGRFEARIQEIGTTNVVFVATESRSRLELGERISERQSLPGPVGDPATAADDASDAESQQNE